MIRTRCNGVAIITLPHHHDDRKGGHGGFRHKPGLNRWPPPSRSLWVKRTYRSCEYAAPDPALGAFPPAGGNDPSTLLLRFRPAGPGESGRQLSQIALRRYLP